jgi:hypothetical protein
MTETNTNTNTTGSSSAMVTDSERYQTKYGLAVMLTCKNYDEFIVNVTEAAPTGNTKNTIAAHSYTSMASETPRPYGILSRLIFDTMRSQIWRTEVMMQFQNDRPIAEDTPNAIPDEVFKTKIYTTLPDKFKTTIKIAQISKDSHHGIFNSFRRNESTRAIKAAVTGTTAVDTNSVTTSRTALHTQKGGRGHGKGRGRGGKRSNDDCSRSRTYCTNCKMNNHSTKDCRLPRS